MSEEMADICQYSETVIKFFEMLQSDTSTDMLIEMFDRSGERHFTATSETTERLLERWKNLPKEYPKNPQRILAITCALLMHGM